MFWEYRDPTTNQIRNPAQKVLIILAEDGCRGGGSETEGLRKLYCVYRVLGSVLESRRTGMRDETGARDGAGAF